MLSLVFLLCLVTCASQAQTADIKKATPSEQSQSSPTPTAAKASPTSPTAATPIAATAPSAAAADGTKFKVPSSYRARTHDGETVYCRKEALIGSRVAKEHCLSLDQVKELEIHNQESRDRMEQNQRICGGGAGCTSP
jgi:hypothetical protein